MAKQRLTKSERLLDFEYPDPEGNVHFSNRKAMEEECVTSLILPPQDWIDFGGPRQITVLIKPGDRLNPPGEHEKAETLNTGLSTLGDIMTELSDKGMIPALDEVRLEQVRLEQENTWAASRRPVRDNPQA